MTTRTEVQVELVMGGLCVDVEELLEVVKVAVGAVVGTGVLEGTWEDELLEDV